MRRLRRSSIVLVISGTLSTFGCVHRKVDGNTTVYATEAWAIILVALASVVVGVLGWYVRRRRKWLGYLMLGGCVLVLCTTVPGLSLSRTIVDPDHVEWNRGNKHYSFWFDELDGIEHEIKKIRFYKMIKKEVHYLDFVKKIDGTVHIQVEPATDRFLQEAIPEIIRRARARGVLCTQKRPK